MQWKKKRLNELLQSIYVVNSWDKWCWCPEYLSCQKFGTLLRHMFTSGIDAAKSNFCRLFHIKTLGLKALN